MGSASAEYALIAAVLVLVAWAAWGTTRPPKRKWQGVGTEIHPRRVQMGLQWLRVSHAIWSDEAFGDVGPVGPLKHLAKEAIEAAENTGDLSEWADLQFLLWDAQRRAGITDEQLLQAGRDKLAKLRKRKWPRAVDGEPCEHVRGYHD